MRTPRSVAPMVVVRQRHLTTKVNKLIESWFWTLKGYLRCWVQFVQGKLILNFETLSWMLICSDLFWFVQGWTIGKRVTLTNTLGRMSWALAFYLILANPQPLKYINILPRINLIMESESFDFKLLLMLLLWQSSNRFVKMAMTPGLWSLLR